MTDHQLPLVSIGIPTYNRADSYLKEAISSALNQTYKNIEIIVSDNCSTDNTESFIKSILDPRIRYFRQDHNIGAINNYNFCLDQAKGDYFLLLHDDDLIDEDFIEICMSRMSQSDYAKDYGIIRTGTRLIDDKGNKLTESPNIGYQLSTEEYFRAWFAGKIAWYLPSTLFNTRMLKEVGGFDTNFQLLPDAVALVKLEVKYRRLDVEDVKASFRVHPGEITHSAKVEDWCDEFLILSKIMCDLMPESEKLIKTEGMQFFSGLNYKRASKVKSPFKRFIAYLIVFKKFKYRYFPPFTLKLIFKNPIYLKILKLKKAVFSA
jgi:glycosyltransferase involved in cell wall biosynthesis